MKQIYFLFSLLAIIFLESGCESNSATIGNNVENSDVEHTIVGQILLPNGLPASKAVVYLHVDSAENTSFALLRSNSDRYTYQTICDTDGYYQFQGKFSKKVYLEVEFEGNMGGLDSLVFTGKTKELNKKPIYLKTKGAIQFDNVNYLQGVSVWISELRMSVNILDTASDVFVQIPAGCYNLLILDDLKAMKVSVKENDTVLVSLAQASKSSFNEENLIAAWEFNNAAQPGIDSSGNGHHGIVGEGTPVIANGMIELDGSTGFKIPLASDFQRNDFVVETRFMATTFGVMDNIIVAEPPGRYGDGWQLRLDTGKVAVHLRDENTHGTTWQILRSRKIQLNTWYTVRLSRSGENVSLWINDTLEFNQNIQGDVGQLNYDLGLGYDAMEQAFHNRYFKGKIDYIRIYAAEYVSQSSSSQSISSSSVQNLSSSSQEVTWLAAWEFNNSAQPTIDFSGNGHHGILGEGDLIITRDSALSLDGASGFKVSMHTDFQRNDFVVETRFMATAFGRMDNIIVAEPPGRYGDGWQLRLDEGILKFHLRDEDTHGTTWIVLGETPITLNQWTVVKLERNRNQVTVWVDGQVSISETIEGDIGQLTYDIGVGYDAMNQAFHDRYFKGVIDYIRYGSI